ncbi:1381_t:CDS:1, partial [Ambispora gerdemannii]
ANSFKGAINQVNIHNSELLSEYEDSYKEKFEKLDIEDELRISFLAGLVASEGSGNYLNDVKKSFKNIKGTLLYKLTSVYEYLDIYHDDVKANISINELTHTEATHAVIGIKWGATIMASFEFKNTNDENRSYIEGILKHKLKNLSQSISEGENLDINDSESDIMSQFAINILGDIVPDHNKHPQSLAEAKKIIAELPLYIKQYKDGKGVPIEYTLFP